MRRVGPDSYAMEHTRGSAGFGAVRARGFGATSSVPLPSTDSRWENGARNVYVAMVQATLRDNGFDPGPIDGIVGPLTLAADARAMKYLLGSISRDARIAMASVEPMASNRWQAYLAAFAWDADARGVKPGGGTPPPSSPDETIPMGPQDLARTERDFGLAGGIPRWAWWAGGAVAAVAVVGIVVAARRR